MAPPGRRRASPSSFAVLLGLVFLFSSTASAASAVLGIDLGTEYIKAALVKPGIPLEIVLTKDSKRKEASAVAFKPLKSGTLAADSFPERFYGSDAVALAARFPGDVYPNLKGLLGIPREGDAVKVYTERYPALEVVELEGRKTAALKSGIFAEGEKSFSVEELLAMELKNVKENAKALAGKGTDIQDVVFTVPPFYTVDERRALEVAARLAGLKVLGMVSDGLAVGINYATSRTFPVVNDGGKAEVHLVFDMGAGSASATVLKFQGKTVKDIGRFNKTIQEVHVLGTGWDRTLGGDSLNMLLVDDMISSFVELPGAKSAELTTERIKTHGRTAAKLWKEAEKVRQVLSANTQTSALFESFLDDVDFRYKVTRSKFEELAANFAARVDGPVNQALATAGLTFADIDSVIVHGGASRTPFVQNRLETLAGKSKIRANVNADEAAVFGAAFKAAGLSPSFRVKEIRDIDTQGYALGIQYMFNIKDRDQKIFTPTSKIGATKDLPFQMMGEFEFTMYQAVPGGAEELVKSPALHFKSGNLTRQVTKMIDTDGCDRETFNNYVQVRLSPVTGAPEVTSAWVTCEAEVEETKGGMMEGVKNLFGMGGKKDQEPLKEAESSSSELQSAISSESSSSSTSPSTSSDPETTEAAKSGGSKKKEVKSSITFHVTQQGYEKHPRKEFKRMQDRLSAFDSSDRARRVREEVLNSLEAFTYRSRDLLENEDFIAASTDQERSTLEEKLSASSDWIYAEGHDATEDILKAKLKDLEALVNPILKRKDEAAKRPEAIKTFQEALDSLKSIMPMVKETIEKAAEASKSAEEASKFAASATSSAAEAASTTADPLADLEEEDMLKPSNSGTADSPVPTSPLDIYTADDLKLLEEKVDKAKKWMEEKQAVQNKLKESDDPAFSVTDLQDQTKKLNDAVMEMMMKKMRAMQQPPKPKPKPKPKTKKPKKPKKPAKDDKDKAETKEERKAAAEPSDEELKEALEKAGIKGEGVKLSNIGDKKELKDKGGRPLVKLDLGEDATEEDIMEAIERATREGRERLEKEKEGKRHDEL
ncbi:heat shock protein 70-like protein-like protein [Lindgomyces ingoldianus]|uniref:Heat shock protein 70-like protein-like protein n=1 Tax=Lindgomyces ingoldianus TaxID=673940 RepID=A0ACB6QTH9_9PLEO|nr:heat shock protein 70-like protein-like protein [Lindgomyces ingoldianus]KAF2469868.1 heat shock protein 70-like protein-like protein [Lindgomyces ingoldianus]